MDRRVLYMLLQRVKSYFEYLAREVRQLHGARASMPSTNLDRLFISSNPFVIERSLVLRRPESLENSTHGDFL
jgi:hypothetical protein